MSKDIRRYVDKTGDYIDPTVLSTKMSGKISCNFTGFDLTTQPIEHKPLTVQLIRTYVHGDRSFPAYMRYIPTNLHIDIRSSIRKMHLLIDAYRLGKCNTFPIEDFVDQSINLGPTFTSYLKKFRLRVFVNKFGGKFFEEDGSEYIHRSRDVKDISEVPPFQYLINWKEPDERDIEYSQIPTKIKKKDIEIYKETVRDLIKDIPESDIKVVTEDEIIFTGNDSKALESSPEGKTNFKWILKQLKKNKEFSSEPLCGRRCVIQVGPGNVRDSVILNVPQSNSVQILEKQVFNICKYIPGSAMLENLHELKQALNRFYNKTLFYLSRDFKKEGWTKPLELLHATLDVLKEKFPSFPCWKYTGIFDEIKVYDPEQERYLKLERGHGIGFANSVTTIYSLALYIITLRNVDISIFDERVGYALAWNDDFVARFSTEEECIEYFECEREVFEKYSAIRKDEACFYGEGFYHFLENYFGGGQVNSKRIYKIFLMLQAMLCPNISIAKLYISSIESVIERDIFNLAMEEIITFFGYEFFPEEIQFPVSLGGWVSGILNGVDMSLTYDIENSDALKAYEANKVSFKFPKKIVDKSKYNSPAIDMFPELLTLNDKFLQENFYLNKTIEEMSLLMRKYVYSSGETRKIFKRFKVERYEAFKKAPFVPLDKFVKNYLHDSLRDVYPSPLFLRKIETKGLIGTYSSRLYESDNDVSEYVFALKGEKRCSKYPLLDRLKAHSSVRNKMRFLDELELSFDAFSPADFRDKELSSANLFTSIDPSININEFYLNPHMIMKISCARNEFTTLPIHSFEVERTILMEKKKIFDRFLTPEEEAILNKYKFKRLEVNQIIDKGNLIELIEEALMESKDDSDIHEKNRMEALLREVRACDVKITPFLIFKEEKKKEKKKKISLEKLYRISRERNNTVPIKYKNTIQGQIIHRILNKVGTYYKIRKLNIVEELKVLSDQHEELEDVLDITQNAFRYVEPLQKVSEDDIDEDEEYVPTYVGSHPPEKGYDSWDS